MATKINRLELENVKRIKAVVLEPSQNGLTLIGGNNGQGKTSVLDSIAWVLGGNKFKPSDPQRQGSTIPPTLKIVMNNGLVVERKGKNSDLKVLDPNGEKGGQQLLDSFIEELALDLPKFLNASNKEKANILLNIIGVGDKLFELEKKETDIYNQRRAIGQIADQKEKFAKEQPYYPDAPKEPVSASNLIKQQQEILARNGENQKKRSQLTTIEKNLESTRELLAENARRIAELENRKKALLEDEAKLVVDIETAKKTVVQLIDESTEELERSIENIEEINVKVRANLDKEKAEEDARGYRDQYSEFTTQLEHVRKEKTDLLLHADLPLTELSIEDGELIYKGFKWDNMSGSDRLKVATAIVRKLKPECGFVLMDKLEQMDMKTLTEFAKWLEEEGLQVIATRVSTGEECSIIIEDGYVKGQEEKEQPQTKKWKEGEF